MNFSKSDCAYVLAGLRLLQDAIHNDVIPDKVIIDLEGLVIPDLQHIDELCERINTAEKCVPRADLQQLIVAVDCDIFTRAKELQPSVIRARTVIGTLIEKHSQKHKHNMRTLVESIATMTTDGEVVEGKPFEMTSEDAISTLGELIHEAREVLEE